MSARLYVGNIPYSMSGEDLEQLFAPHGSVKSSVVISDRESGRSRGFGFVEMGSSEEAEKALEQLNGTDVGGRNVVVNYARERQGGG